MLQMDLNKIASIALHISNLNRINNTYITQGKF